MADGRHAGALGAVYEAKRPEDVAALYDGWAGTYEAEMASAGGERNAAIPSIKTTVAER